MSEAADKARKLVEKNPVGTPTERAQVWATLALAEEVAALSELMRDKR